MKSIQFTSEVEEDLLQLVNLLVEKRYFSSNEYAFLYVEEIVTYIRKNLPLCFSKPVPIFFARFGVNLRYFIYRKSPRTTWYIFFEETDQAYYIRHITNNHIAGKYFNV